VDRIFLDANVLFSAVFQEDAGVRRLWDLPNVELMTSEYAVEEARRNLDEASQRTRLDRLVDGLKRIGAVPDRALPGDAVLPEKDRPILLAAIDTGSTHLLTGDTTHFGKLFRRRIGGVLILRPAEYLRG
jgi:predicted nucleic acid-binding protein